MALRARSGAKFSLSSMNMMRPRTVPSVGQPRVRTACPRLGSSPRTSSGVMSSTGESTERISASSASNVAGVTDVSFISTSIMIGTWPGCASDHVFTWLQAQHEREARRVRVDVGLT